jgi:hypothetical protein
MSFRLFIYYCAVLGGCAAFVGWGLGRVAAPGDPTGQNLIVQGLKGLFLGMLIALGLGLVDGLWNLSLRQAGPLLIRAIMATVVGALGGLVGGVIGGFLYIKIDQPAVLIFGWTLTGLLVGIALGIFDWLSQLLRREDRRGARRKLVNGVIGGVLGGVAGGALSLVLSGALTVIFQNKPRPELWVPSATGFVALGVCIGLAIGLAQVILREAWVRVEKGFRQGRQLILTKAETTIGRAESCDIGLFGDGAVQRLHARIVLQGNRYLLADAGTPDGTFLNGSRVNGPAALRSGDEIRIGNSVLSFRERARRGQ